MNSQAVLSAETIHQYLLVLVDPGSVTELRIPRTSKGTQSGYFDDPATLSQIAAAWSGRASGLYTRISVLASWPPAILHPTASIGAVSLVFPSRATPAAQEGANPAPPGT